MSSLKGSRIIADPLYDLPYRRPYSPRYYDSRCYPANYIPPTKEVYGYSEYIPIQKSVIDYEPEYQIYYRPVEKVYTDYREVRHEVDYIPVPRVEYDYQAQKRSYVVGETNNEPLVRSRIAQDRYYYDRVNPAVIRPANTLDWRQPGAYRSPGYYSTYYSPYKYL